MRTKERVKQYGEVFTPIALVNEMLDKFPVEVWKLDKTFIDNSCGNGNFLVEILKRKISKGHDPFIALSTIYGVELLEDNVLECRKRLFIEVRKCYNELNEQQKDKIRDILLTNIVCADALKYNYEFKERDAM